MDEILRLEAVSKTFPQGFLHTQHLTAVNSVSFSLVRGETFGLIGHSGCGKTTLSRMVAGLLPPSEGTIEFEGRPLSSFTRREKKSYARRVQMVFQHPQASLDPSMTILESLLEPLAIHHIGNRREERMDLITKTLPTVGLSTDLLSRYPHQISGGEAQRFVICRALLLDPDVLILDEPTSMLDLSVQASLLRLLQTLQVTRQLTYLYITHDVELLTYISHTIGVMERGQLVEVGPREEIFSAPSHPATQKLLAPDAPWKGDIFS